MAEPRRLERLGDVAQAYDGFILDLWGVVHDGLKPFPAVIPALREMKRARRKTWLLSNAPRRARVVADSLAAMGVTPDLYDGLMTSGEATWLALRDKYLADWGGDCLHIGGARDDSLFADIDIRRVKKTADAHFALVSGVVDFSDTPAQYAPLLQECRAAGLPLVCANPDIVVHVGDQLVHCAGAIAALYAEMGGEVVYFGKPHRAVYTHCLDAMGAGSRVLAVGDGMHTDIAGAAGAGIDSALVVTGIHRDAAGEDGFFEKYPFRPQYVTDGLAW